MKKKKESRGFTWLRRLFLGPAKELNFLEEEQIQSPDVYKRQGLDYVQDDMGNVVIYKAATPGYEDHPGVIIQAHIDMVCEKVPESTHDFEKDPLELYRCV